MSAVEIARLLWLEAAAIAQENPPPDTCVRDTTPVPEPTPAPAPAPEPAPATTP